MSNPSLPLHIELDHFAVDDDCIVIGGRKLTDIAESIGTPFYAYDSGVISQRVEQLKQALPANVHLHYALKANPMAEVAAHLAKLVDGFDVASAGELKIALAAGVPPDRISMAGPGKSDTDLRCAVEAKIIINLESELELDRVIQVGRQLGNKPRVAIRVNPDFELKTSGMKMGGGPQQFGIDAERVPELLRGLADLPVEFVGLHIFSGSQNLRAESICEAQEKTLQLATTLLEHAPTPARLLNIGGGLGIPYFPGDKRLDPTPIGSNLGKLLADHATALADTDIAVELGRHIVGEAGIYVTRVVDRKVSRGLTYLICDGGLHQHLSASGNFGQVIRKNYPVLVGNRVFAEPREVVSVVGPLCTPLDLLANKMSMAAAQVGDLIVVFQSGAYGLSASPIAFLGHPPPAEIFM